MLIDIIKWQYPAAIFGPGRNVEVSNNGYAEFISIWELPDTPPTMEQLVEWATDPEFLNWLLDQKKAIAITEMERQRGEARRPLEKDILFQQMALVGKHINASTWVVDSNPDPQNYPVMYGLEAKVRGMTPEELAAFNPTEGISAGKIVQFSVGEPTSPQAMAMLILSTGIAWLTFNDYIDSVAHVARQAIQAATSVEEVEQIMAGIEWPALP